MLTPELIKVKGKGINKFKCCRNKIEKKNPSEKKRRET